MKDIQEIHEKILSKLKEIRKKDPNLFFSMRQTNRYNRLEKGYWFHGNDDYLAVSFWSGRDWKNKTPNIYFEVNRNRRCLFIFSAKDSEYKAKFANEIILPLLQNELKDFLAKTENHGSDKVLIYNLGEGDYISILQSFIENIKPKIDAAIQKNRDEYDSYIQAMQEYSQKDDIQGLQEINEIPESDFIGFIEESEFQANYDRIRSYHMKMKLELLTENRYYINSVSISEIGNIANTLKLQIPLKSQCIFLTGENGCGKSTILRALTSCFYPSELSDHSLIKSGKINLDFQNQAFNINNIGFAAYGPSRLISSSIEDTSAVLPEQMKPWYSMFYPDGVLLGFEELYRIFKDNPYRLEEIKVFLDELLNGSEKTSEQLLSNETKGEMIPQLARVNFDRFVKEGIIDYYEKDKYNNDFKEPRTFEELASGVRSLLALIADLLVRIISKNPDQLDISNFEGIVLIDEIDIHFHPSMQKQIIEILTGNFKNIQFIFTTHSPISLLGAPKNSAFYRVDRTVQEGITVKRLTKLEKEIKNLLPNTILTSPIFGMNDLTPFGNIDTAKLNVDRDYAEGVLTKLLKQNIDDVFEKKNWKDHKLFKED